MNDKAFSIACFCFPFFSSVFFLATVVIVVVVVANVAGSLLTLDTYSSTCGLLLLSSFLVASFLDRLLSGVFISRQQGGLWPRH